MRSREFIMKDAYSFDKDWESLDESYRQMYDAYEKVFTRCGLTFRAVEADTGAMGGSDSHEFCALSEHGESEIAYCEQCDMALHTEKADCVDAGPDDSEIANRTRSSGMKTIDRGATFLSSTRHRPLSVAIPPRSGISLCSRIPQGTGK